MKVMQGIWGDEQTQTCTLRVKWKWKDDGKKKNGGRAEI